MKFNRLNIKRRYNKLANMVVTPLIFIIVVCITFFIFMISRTIFESEREVYDNMIEYADQFLYNQLTFYTAEAVDTLDDYVILFTSDINGYERDKMLFKFAKKYSDVIDNVIYMKDIDNYDDYNYYYINDNLRLTNQRKNFDPKEILDFHKLHYINERSFIYYDTDNNKVYFSRVFGSDVKSLVSLEVDMSSIYNMLESNLFNKQGQIALLTEDGKIISHTDKSLIGKSVYELGFNEDKLNSIFKSVHYNKKFSGDVNQGISTRFKDKYNGINFSFVPLNIKEYEINWIIMFEIPNEVFINKIILIALSISGGGLLTIVIIILFSRFTINKSLRPIDEIVDAMNKATSGDFTVRTNVKSSNEIETIGVRLNEMLEHMEKDRDNLLKQRNEISELLKEVEGLMQENDMIYYETIASLAKTIDAKDSYTGGHCERVTEYSIKVGRKLGLSGDQLRVLSYGSMLHDIGKIGVPESIITKEGFLTAEEYEHIKSHSNVGFNILKDIHFLKDARNVVLNHHERYDGTGYPNGLSGDNIDLMSKIVAISDSFDAMSSDRSYRKALPKEVCVSEIERCRGTQFDPEITDVFLSLINNGDINPYNNMD